MDFIWHIFSDSERRYRKQFSSFSTPIVVMGFQRSGTSLVSSMVAACGVHFGIEADMKAIDARNPKGFFEHEPLFKVVRRFLKEAGYRNENEPYFGNAVSHDFRAKGILAKISRMRTRQRLMRVIHSLAQGKDRWGLKSFPVHFYFLSHYLPNRKIIGVYRDPFSNAVSVMQAWPAGFYTFAQALHLWTEANKDLLYHLSHSDSILIQYEDLFDDSKRQGILETLVTFVGAGMVEDIEKLIVPSLNRSSLKVDKLRHEYPLSAEAQIVLTALNQKKI